MRDTRRAWACALLSAALLSGWFTLPASAQERRRKPVVVSFGQPNIWSLEQAHYLLARMHQENLDMRAASLAALDANETNATRITILKQLLEVGAEFDQSIGVNNARIQRNNEFNDSRRQQLVTRRDSLSVEALGLSREIPNLEIERAKMNTDPSATAESKAVKDTEIAKKKEELAAINQQVTSLDSQIGQTAPPNGSLTSPTPSATPFNASRLPSGLFSTDELKGLLKAERDDPKLNATTKLDNYVQLQYEIISKQLTLLRDEVGPGERLVFLEMPESIYTTPGDGDEKMAQAWWHVNGYTRTDPLLRLLLELYDVELKWKRIQAVPGFASFAVATDGTACGIYAKAFGKRADEGKTDESNKDRSRESVLRETFSEFQCEYENARERLFKDLFREARSDFARAQQGGARDTSEMVQAIQEAIAVSPRTPQEGKAVERATERTNQRRQDANGEITQTIDRKKDGLTAQKVKEMRLNLLCLLSDPNLKLDNPKSPDPKLVQGDNPQQYCGDLGKFDFKKGIEYVRVDDRADRDVNGLSMTRSEIELRTVRTVDIIPRQSSLNVNDIQETVKATGILAAFKFLFGFAGQVNFQRQRDQFEQFIHQELYASGFGKGSRDFGWTFGAVPGTKRVAPGVRTTYAVLVVPDDAESLVLSARGCYFPRKSYEPLDFEDTAHLDWDRESKFRNYNCGDEQTYIVTIPGGGDRSNFWVTSVDYVAGVRDGNRATVSVRGKNFSTQMGVLVNGVPLFPVVGLAQPLMQARARTDSDAEAARIRGLALPRHDCAGEQSPGQGAGQNGAQPAKKVICGDFERIDPEQIVISFGMPDGFNGTPTITLVAPGKSVDINPLDNISVNGVRNTALNDDRTAFIFGERPKPPEPPKPRLTITDFKVFSVSADNRQALAILTGTEFKADDLVYVNGKQLLDVPQPPPPEPPRRGRRRATRKPQLSEFKEFKSAKLYRLVFNLPPGEDLTVTVSRDGAEPQSKTVANPLAPKKEEKPPGKEEKPPGK